VPAQLSLEALTKRYAGGVIAVDRFDLDIAKGEFVCLVGPSGCGKTTTLKMINRLIEPSEGRILLAGRDVGKMSAVALRREIGYVIQQIGLFPHFSVADNIAVVPRLKGWPKAKIAARVDELLHMVGMDPADFAKRRPHQLSGGQQQRIGVLRALAAEPDLILMDEPFGALDPITRATLQRELKRLQAELHKTIVFVTHDMDEALLLADRVVLMRDGRIVQAASPRELVAHPAEPFVSTFLGEERIFAHPEWLTVGHYMEPLNGGAKTNGVQTFDRDEPLIDALEEILARPGDGFLVTEAGRPVGILERRRLAGALIQLAGRPRAEAAQ